MLFLRTFFVILIISSISMVSCKKSKKNKKSDDAKTSSPIVKKDNKKKTVPVQPVKVVKKDRQSRDRLEIVKIKTGNTTLQNKIPLNDMVGVRDLIGRNKKVFVVHNQAPWKTALFSTETKKKEKEFAGVVKPPVFSSNNKYAALMSGNKISVISWPESKEIASLSTLDKKGAKQKAMSNDLFVSVAFSDDGAYFATGEWHPGGFDGNYTQIISLWDTKTWQRIFSHTEEVSDAGTCDVSFINKGDTLYSAIIGGDDGSISQRFTIKSTNLVEETKPYSMENEVSFNLKCGDCIEKSVITGDNYVVASSVKLDGKLGIYSLKTGKILKEIPWKKSVESDNICKIEYSQGVFMFGKCHEVKGEKDQFGNDKITYVPYEFVIINKKFKVLGVVKGKAGNIHPAGEFIAIIDSSLKIFNINNLKKPVSTALDGTLNDVIRFSGDGKYVILSDKNNISILTIE